MVIEGFLNSLLCIANCSTCESARKLNHPDNEGLYICKEIMSHNEDRTVTEDQVCSSYKRRKKGKG